MGDNSINGIAAPLDGFRYRVGMEQYFGDYKFSAATVDVRKYWRVKPITIAARSYNYLRLGKEGENLYPLFVGYPYFIRGYEANSLYNSSTGMTSGFDINQLSGSKMAVFNLELRLPFTGPKKLSAIPSNFLFTDLNLFFDAGLAWNEDSKIVFKNQPENNIDPKTDPITGNIILDQNGKPIYQKTNQRVPAMSIGISLRVNVFGAFVLEPYYAIPFQRNDLSVGTFGLTFAPGW